MNRQTRFIIIIWIFFAVADQASKFLPMAPFAFRAWEPLTSEHNSIGPFTREESILKEHSYGDLANLGNLPQQRLYRLEKTTTDECGARKTSISPWDELDGLYFGTSYGAGGGNTDGDIITERIYQKSGLKIYNLAGVSTGPSQLKTLTSQLHFKQNPTFQPVVILELPARFDAHFFQSNYLSDEHYPEKTLQVLCSAQGQSVADRLEHLKKRESRLMILLNHWRKALQNDVIFPNTSIANVYIGQWTAPWPGLSPLFLSSEVASFEQSRDPQGVIAIFAQIADVLRQLHFRSYVLIIPEKIRVYNSLLSNPAMDRSPQYVQQLQQGLENKNLPVVNLLPHYVGMAQNQQWPYYSDDTHWSPQGVEAAADLLIKKILNR